MTTQKVKATDGDLPTRTVAGRARMLARISIRATKLMDGAESVTDYVDARRVAIKGLRVALALLREDARV